MQHFAVCTLLMGCQDGAWECHRAVCHHAVRVEAGGGDVQVSFPVHLLPALLLLTAHRNTPNDSFQLFLTPCSRWTGLRVSEFFRYLLWVGRWSSAFPCHSTMIPIHRAAARGGVPCPHHECWGGDSPPKPIADMVIDFCSGKKRRKIFSHNLLLCHCVQAQNQLKKRNNTAALVNKGQVDIWALQGRFCKDEQTVTLTRYRTDIILFIHQKMLTKSRFPK